MQKEIKKILDELYQLDGDLRAHEKEVIKIISLMLKNRPEPKLDQAFAQQLRAQLLARASAQSPDSRFSALINNFNFMKKFSYGLTGAVIAAVLIVPTFYYANQKSFAVTVEEGIVRLPDNAYGVLNSGSSLGSPEARSFATGLGGGGTTQVALNAEADVAVKEAPAPSAVDSRMMIYPYYQYTYKYVGEPLTLEESTMPVYKRIKGSSAGVGLAGLAKNSGLGQIDLATFANASVDTITFTQNQNRGYMINVNFSESMISINQDWRQWQSSYQDVYQPMDISQMPSDEELIALANQFISQHKINLKNYGEPVVNNDWRVLYERAVSSERYVPDYVTVVYPLVIDGKEMHDQSGYAMGISVGIDARNKVVTSAYNITVPNYQSSAYAVETDTNRILEIAQRGGSVMPLIADPNATSVELELGTPTLTYIQFWSYNESTKMSEELYAPGYIFPVINNSQQGYYPSSIVIPVVKDLLDEREQNSGGPIRILDAPAASTGSSTGAAEPAVMIEPDVRALPVNDEIK